MANKKLGKENKLSQKGLNYIKDFKRKYNVILDVTVLEEMFSDIKDITNPFKEDTKRNLDNYNYALKDRPKDIEKIKNMYNDAFKTVLIDAIKQKAKIEAGKKFDENLSLGMMIHDFNNLMQNLQFTDSVIPNHIQFADTAFGGLSEIAISKLATSCFPEIKDDITKEFEGFSSKEIKEKITNDYLNSDEKNYREYIAATQALKERYDKRTFFDKIFHPIDSYRESSALSSLYKNGKKRFNKDIKDDVLNAHIINKESQVQINSLMELESDFEEINENKNTYSINKLVELKKRFEKNSVLNVTTAMKNADSKYKKEILPALEKLYESKGLDMTLADFEALDTDNKLDKDDYISYGYKFLEEKKYQDYVKPALKELSANNNKDITVKDFREFITDQRFKDENIFSDSEFNTFYNQYLEENEKMREQIIVNEAKDEPIIDDEVDQVLKIDEEIEKINYQGISK